ncbi:MAG: OmpA family protein [Myxococcota bacterium]
MRRAAVRVAALVATVVGAGRAAAEPIFCSAAGGTGCAAPIPDPGTLTTSMSLPADVCADGDTISCLALVVRFGHTLAGDLQATLAHGAVSALVAEPTCCEGGGLVRVSDGGGPGFGLCRPDGAGAGGATPTLTNRPVTPLAAFGGMAPSGTWTLTLSDGEVGGYGALVDWGLEVGCGAHAVDLGQPCTSNVECRSCSCVDGVCCDSACGGGAPDDCMGCSTATGAAENGHCQDARVGTPFGDLPIGAPCDGDDADRCPTGKLACQGATLTCAESGPATVERCNGADDDCDGVIDDGFDVGAACDGPDADLCATGVWSCEAGDRVCHETDPDRVETQNGKDDDCDGVTDEGFAPPVCPDDRDCDGVVDGDDNCPDTQNPLQKDLDGDHVGDACDPSIDGGTTHGTSGCAGGAGGAADAGPGGALAGALAVVALLIMMRGRRGRRALGGAVAVVVAVASGDRAEAYRGAFDPRFHQPAPGGAQNGVSVDGTLVLQHLQLSAGLVLDMASNPLVLTFPHDDGTPDADVDLLGGEVRADVMLALGLFDRFQIGLALPVMFARSGSDGAEQVVGETLAGAALGDLRLVPKLALLGGERGFGLSVALPVGLPTSGGGYLAGSRGLSLEPRLIVGWAAASWRVRANVGFILRTAQDGIRDLGVGDELRFGLNGEVDVVADRLTLYVEGLAKLAADGDTPSGGETTPVEVGLGARLTLGRVHGLLVGGGVGLSQGYGTPDAHVYLGYAYTPVRVGDQDSDGVLDDRDRCPSVPEDEDGFEDGDGCPDADDDHDGVLDAEDGPRGSDGLGRCRLQAEDKDGFEDDDGCPDADNDHDGFADAVDGPRDASGLGACRDQPETKNGYQDDDGCPDEKKMAEVKEKTIDLSETVHFDPNEAVVLPESFALLDAVAKLLGEHPELLRIEVAGHTDEVAAADYNQGLSERRAAAVVAYLVAKGIDPGRLVPKGYGESRPIDPGHDEAARQKNRRVELTILERKGGGTP